MLVDRIERAERYYSLHPGFEEALRFLARGREDGLAPGEHPIGSRGLHAVVTRQEAPLPLAPTFEVHRKYIDIQMPLKGSFLVGWKPLARCEVPGAPFDPEKDIGFFGDVPEQWVRLLPGDFVILYPDDAHAPAPPESHVLKAVVKVPLKL